MHKFLLFLSNSGVSRKLLLIFWKPRPPNLIPGVRLRAGIQNLFADSVLARIADLVGRPSGMGAQRRCLNRETSPAIGHNLA
jgi:hypothetical protein